MEGGASIGSRVGFRQHRTWGLNTISAGWPGSDFEIFNSYRRTRWLQVARMVVEHSQSGGSIGFKNMNRRVSFFEESGDLAPGQLYSTESGRYFWWVSISCLHCRLFHAGKIAIITGIPTWTRSLRQSVCQQEGKRICLSRWDVICDGKSLSEHFENLGSELEFGSFT